MPYSRTRRTGRPSVARWMDLRRPGTCHVCGNSLPAGTRAFWDPADRTTTCTTIECAKFAGLTKSVWHGAPTSGRWVDVLSEHRIAPRVGEHADPFRFTRSRGYYGRDAGRCEDAPCCGCC
jgi:hypothetical protein